MRLIDAQVQLLKLNLPVIQTSDAAICLNVTRQNASQILLRLAKTGVVTRIDRGLWAIIGKVEPLQLPEYLTAPFPAYISLQTALYYHGLISQIPQNIYAVSISRTRKIDTSLGTISIHRIEPEFFGGFEVVGAANIKMACQEKALLDILYLSTARSLLFKRLPEIEIPKNFNTRKCITMINKISSQRLKTIVTNSLEKILAR